MTRVVWRGTQITDIGWGDIGVEQLLAGLSEPLHELAGMRVLRQHGIRREVQCSGRSALTESVEDGPGMLGESREEDVRVEVQHLGRVVREREAVKFLSDDEVLRQGSDSDAFEPCLVHGAFEGAVSSKPDGHCRDTPAFFDDDAGDGEVTEVGIGQVVELSASGGPLGDMPVEDRSKARCPIVRLNKVRLALPVPVPHSRVDLHELVQGCVNCFPVGRVDGRTGADGGLQPGFSAMVVDRVADVESLCGNPGRGSRRACDVGELDPSDGGVHGEGPVRVVG